LARGEQVFAAEGEVAQTVPDPQNRSYEATTTELRTRHSCAFTYDDAGRLATEARERPEVIFTDDFESGGTGA